MDTKTKVNPGILKDFDFYKRIAEELCLHTLDDSDFVFSEKIQATTSNLENWHWDKIHEFYCNNIALTKFENMSY